MKKKIKLLLICTNSDLAGAPVHVRDLVLGLTEKNWDVSVVFGSEGEVSRQLREKGVTVFHIPNLKSNYNLLDDFRAALALRLIMNVFKPDLLHCHSTKAGMIGRILGEWYSVPTIYTVHGWGFGENRGKLKSFLLRRVEKFLVRKTSKYIAVSEFDRMLGEQSLGIPAHLIDTIYNGTVSGTATREKIVGTHLIMVARTAQQKDHATLMRALSSAQFDTVSFLGTGTDKSSFKDMAKSLMGKNFSKARFVGSTEHVIQHLRKSSVFVLTSNYEGLPISIIEAMSIGLPVIATDVGGVGELVKHQKTGFLVEKANVEQVKQAINFLSSNTELAWQMGLEGRTRFEAFFSLENCVRNTEMVYQKIVGKDF